MNDPLPPTGPDSGSCHAPDGFVAEWDHQGNGSWRAPDGSHGKWRADGSSSATDETGHIQIQRLADGSGRMKAKDGGNASWDSEGNGQWSTPQGARGRFHADGSGSIHHPDGAVESWNLFGEITCITPDGVEFSPQARQLGCFPRPDGSEDRFAADGTTTHLGPEGDTLVHHSDGSWSWHHPRWGEVRGDFAGRITAIDPTDRRMITRHPDGGLEWQRGAERFWLGTDGRGGWSQGTEASGWHHPDGTCLHGRPHHPWIWRDASGNVGWWDEAGNQGGHHRQGLLWSLHADGSGLFADAALSLTWNRTGHGSWRHRRRAITGTLNPDQQSGLLITLPDPPQSWQATPSGELEHPDDRHEAWEAHQYTLLTSDGAIGVLLADGSGSWSTPDGMLDSWSSEAEHRITHGDGSFERLHPDGSWEWHTPEGSTRLSPEESLPLDDRAQRGFDPGIDATPPTVQAMLSRLQAEARRALLTAQARTVRLRHRLTQLRLPPLQERSPEPEPIFLAAQAEADARMQLGRARLHQTAFLLLRHQLERYGRRPRSRLAAAHSEP